MTNAIIVLGAVDPTLVSGVLGFLAAIAATGVGYRQWRKQSAIDRSKEFDHARADAAALTRADEARSAILSEVRTRLGG